jgi:hypothetical protein
MTTMLLHRERRAEVRALRTSLASMRTAGAKAEKEGGS